MPSLALSAAADAEPFEPGQVTRWQAGLASIAPDTANRMFELLYDDLRRLASGHMRRESASHTFCAAGLAHEAWLRDWTLARAWAPGADRRRLNRLLSVPPRKI